MPSPRLPRDSCGIPRHVHLIASGRMVGKPYLIRIRFASGQWIRSCSILTTTPNAVTSSVHNRMPVILDPDCYNLWLDPGMHDMRVVSDMLRPYDARMMRSFPVSKQSSHRWESLRHDGMGLVQSGTEYGTVFRVSTGLPRLWKPCQHRAQQGATS